MGPVQPGAPAQGRFPYRRLPQIRSRRLLATDPLDPRHPACRARSLRRATTFPPRRPKSCLRPNAWTAIAGGDGVHTTQLEERSHVLTVRDLIGPAAYLSVAGTVQDNNPGMDGAMAQRIADEGLKFVATCAATPDAPLAPSRVVDEGWHALILHTKVYENGRTPWSRRSRRPGPSPAGARTTRTPISRITTRSWVPSASRPCDGTRPGGGRAWSGSASSSFCGSARCPVQVARGGPADEGPSGSAPERLSA